MPPARIPELVRTYKLLSDGEGPRFSVRFAGALVGIALAVLAFGAIYYFGAPEHSAPPNHFAATSSANADGTRTDYVGYLPEAFSPSIGFDPSRVEEGLRAWEAAHPGAVVLAKEPRWMGSHLIGYDIRYREA